MSSLLTVSECQTVNSSILNNDTNNNESVENVSNESAPVANTRTITRNRRQNVVPQIKRKRNIAIEPIDIEGVQARARLANSSSSNSIYSDSSSESTQTSSDDDSQSSTDNDIKKNVAKRQRLESTISTYSQNNLYNIEEDSSPYKVEINVKNEKIIGYNEYELVDHGRDGQAYEFSTGKIFYALFLKIDEYKKFMKLAARIEKAKQYFPMDEFREIKWQLIPKETRIVRGKRKDGVYLLLPNSAGSLQSSTESKSKPLPESQVQPIIKQIVKMVEFCHSVNIVFRDFQTKKFVFTDKEKTKIRIHNPLVLTMLESLNSEYVLSGDKLPVNFISPEQLSRRNCLYSALKADMWGLGILTFLLLTNKYPFSGENPRSYIDNIKRRKFSCELSPTDSEASRWFVFGLLNSQPNERPTASRAKYMHWMSMTSQGIEQRYNYITKGDKINEMNRTLPLTERHSMILSLSYPAWIRQQEVPHIVPHCNISSQNVQIKA